MGGRGMDRFPARPDEFYDLSHCAVATLLSSRVPGCHVPGCHELGETRQRLISLFQAVVCQLLLVLGKLRLEPWIP